jgi:hypothetical protein
MEIFNWIQSHWAIFSVIAAGIVTILNAATTLWHDHPKAIKWLTLLISAFSLIKSKNAEPGPLGAIKMPFIPESRNKSKSNITITTTILILFMSLFLFGCKTTSTGNQVFDPATALDVTCNMEPAANLIAQVAICNNLKEPAKSTCLKVASTIHAMAPSVLAGIGAIYDVCKGETPRNFPRK